MSTENELLSDENFKRRLLLRLDHIEENLIYMENQLRQIEDDGKYLKEMIEKTYARILQGR